MTAPEKIKLADDMIKESREYTIRNYLDTVQEIEAVEGAQSLPQKESFTEMMVNKMVELHRQDFLKTYPDAY